MICNRLEIECDEKRCSAISNELVQPEIQPQRHSTLKVKLLFCMFFRPHSERNDIKNS